MRRVLAVVVSALLFVAGIGAAAIARGGPPPPPPVPASVPHGIVPETVVNGELAFYESELPGVREAFANAGEMSLAADGRLYELRKADRLVGVLQLTTVMPEVDLENERHRRQILQQLLPGVRDELLVDEVRVWVTELDGKFTYLWFGEEMFLLLTLKPASDDTFEPEVVVSDVVMYNLSSDNWEPLYIEEELEDL